MANQLYVRFLVVSLSGSFVLCDSARSGRDQVGPILGALYGDCIFEWAVWEYV
jgi:hypothetical protein